METFSIDLSQGDEVITRLTIAVEGDKAELHQEVYKFSPSIYKQMLVAFEELKGKLKNKLGINKIYMGTESHQVDDKMKRYWKMMGFSDLKTMTVEGKTLTYGEMEI